MPDMQAIAAATNPLALKDYTLILDKSGSMGTKDMPNGQTRWKAAEESTYAIAVKIFGFDPDGLDLILFSSTSKCFANVTPEKVAQIFQENDPFGGTQMAEALQIALDNFFAKRDAGKLKPNGEMILFVGDGQPDSHDDVVRVLLTAAQRLRDSDKLSIAFLQAGRDAAATEFFRFLDTGLKERLGARRDIVATVKMEDIEKVGLQQALLDIIASTSR